VAPLSNQQYEFGPFRLDSAARLVFRNEDPVALAPKTFDLLALLAGNPGRAMSRTEIMAILWPDTAVEEGNLSFQISTLRKALGPEGSKWVETVPRHGYRFRTLEAVEPSLAVAPARQGSQLRMWIAAAAALLAVVTFGSLLVQRREPVESAASVPLTTYPGSEIAPSFSPDGKSVAFMWDNGPGGSWDIYVKLPDVQAPLRFTSAPQDEISPAWSPDGRTIAFMRILSPASAQYIVKPYPDGAERTLMTVEPCAPDLQLRVLAWHPGGNHLIITKRQNERSCGLAALSIATGAATSLTEPPMGQTDSGPAVSPDGSKLAFIRGAGYPGLSLYVTRLSQDLKTTGSAWKVTSETARMEWGLTWMPDSQELVYTRGNSVADFALFRVAASGGGKPRPVSGTGPMSFWPAVSAQGSLAFTLGHPGKAVWRAEMPRDAGGTPVSSPLLSEVAPSSQMQQYGTYSPDGERIVFESERSGQREIWTVGISGSPLQQLTNLAAIAQGPAWSPDGSRVAFAAAPQKQRDIYVVNSGGGETRPLTEDPSDDAAPSWSQDGRWIYFHSNRSGTQEVWRMAAEGGVATQITRAGGMNPQESPQGFVYYRKRESLWRLPVSGGGPESLVLEGLAHMSNPVLMQDGVFFVAAKPAAATNGQIDSKICFYDFTTGHTRDIAAIPGPLGWGFSVSSDRRNFLVTRTHTATSDLRFISHF
jgi:Tol biopolymer transport system component/DNA-binding winged helix-turn-helix (wHTH) protein